MPKDSLPGLKRKGCLWVNKDDFKDEEAIIDFMLENLTDIINHK